MITPESEYKDVVLSKFQKKCLNLFEMKQDCLIIAPSSCGKTFVAEKYIQEYFYNNFGHFLKSPKKFKVIMSFPYRAIAIQEFEKMFSLLEDRGIKVLLAVGGLEIDEEQIINANLVIGTFEKILALLKKYKIIGKYLKILLVDEFHFLGTDRGKVIEQMVLEIKNKPQKTTQLLLLSSSIGNPTDLINWLNCALVIENSRPVPLHLDIQDTKSPLNLLVQTSKSQTKAIYFCNSRFETEKLAKKLCSKLQLSTNTSLEEYFVSIKEDVEEEIERVLENIYFPPLLNEVVRYGVAYHHAGLSDIVRLAIEQLYSEGKIHTLISTSTLSTGVNLPAEVVFYSLLQRKQNIDNNAIFQSLGRAGRLGLKEKGEGIIICPLKAKQKHITTLFTQKDGSFMPKFSKIESKIGNYDTLLQLYLEDIVYTETTYKREIDFLLQLIEGSFWFSKYGYRLTRGYEDKHIHNSLFSSNEVDIRSGDVIEYYERFDRCNKIFSNEMEIQSISVEGYTTKIEIKEDMNLFIVKLGANKRFCSCINPYSNYVCRHQRFLFMKHENLREKYLTTYGVIDFLVENGFIVRSASHSLNSTPLGKIAAGFFVHPYDILSYLESLGKKDLCTLSDYLQLLISRDKQIKSEIISNELSKQCSLQLMIDIFNNIPVRKVCAKYGISDALLESWKELLIHRLKLFKSLNQFIGRVDSEDLIEGWQNQLERVEEPYIRDV